MRSSALPDMLTVVLRGYGASLEEKSTHLS